jgi:hypothetical protein
VKDDDGDDGDDDGNDYDDDDDDEIPLLLRILIRLRSVVISFWENGRPCYTPILVVKFSTSQK